MRFARTKWKIKRLIHPVEIISRVLSVLFIVIVLLTYYEIIDYTVGFLVHVIIILIKVPIYIRRNIIFNINI
jgi:hypothetical protein